MQDFKLLYKLYSGFEVAVKPLCPFYLDFLDEAYPYKEYPKRAVELAGGDTYEIPWKPSEDVVYDPEHEDYELYIRYEATTAYNADLDVVRNKVREDFLLATAIEIVDGPVDFHDTEWMDELEGAFTDKGYTLPDHEGALKILFLKAVVITLPQERMSLIEAAVYREVTETELASSLDKF